MKENTNLDVLVISLKSGEYDGTSIMQAWIAIERLMKIEQELATLKASIPKIKADAFVSGFESRYVDTVADFDLEDMNVLSRKALAEFKLEAGE